MATVNPGQLKSKMVKKTYNFITHPDLPGFYIENHGDRQMRLAWPSGRCHETSTVKIDGDPNWEITDENIAVAAECVFEEKIEELKEEEKKEKSKSRNDLSIWDEFDGVFESMNTLMDKVFRRKS
jgi:hypothetical protein